jgi:hypothetical protein
MSSSLPKRAKRKKVGHKFFGQFPLLRVSTHMKRLLYAYLICIAVSALAAAIFASSQQQPRLPDPFRAEQRAAVSFQLYYPYALPAPYYVDVASLGRTEESVVTMRITDGAGKGQFFTISQQRLPNSINLDAFYESFGGRTSFKTDLGQAVTGTIDDGNTRIVSLLTEDNTWILVQAPATVGLNVLQESLQSLVASR